MITDKNIYNMIIINLKFFIVIIEFKQEPNKKCILLTSQMQEDQPFQQLLVSWKRLYLPLNRM